LIVRVTEITREEGRMNLTIRPVTPDQWPALEDLFGENGASGGCWCMYWRIGRAYRDRPREKNKVAFREIVMRGPRRACSPLTASSRLAGVS